MPENQNCPKAIHNRGTGCGEASVCQKGAAASKQPGKLAVSIQVWEGCLVFRSRGLQNGRTSGAHLETTQPGKLKMASAAIGLCSILRSQDHKGNLKSFAWMTEVEAHKKKAHEIRPPVLVPRTSKSCLQVKLMAEGSEEA